MSQSTIQTLITELEEEFGELVPDTFITEQQTDRLQEVRL